MLNLVIDTHGGGGEWREWKMFVVREVEDDKKGEEEGRKWDIIAL